MRNFKKTITNKNLKELGITGQDYSDTCFYECDGRGVSLNGTNLTGCSFPKTNFTGARLLGVDFTLDCLTFTDAIFGEDQVYQYLYLITLSQIPLYLRVQIEEIIGKQRLELYKKVLGCMEK